MMNSKGPRHDPWGIPIFTLLISESIPLNLQNCSRLDRQDWKHILTLLYTVIIEFLAKDIMVDSIKSLFKVNEYYSC